MEMTTEEHILFIIRALEPLHAFEHTQFHWSYIAEEQMLHVSFDITADADESIDAEFNADINGDVLIHTSNGNIIGFSVIDIDMGNLNGTENSPS
jgi:hypothetical protein